LANETNLDKTALLAAVSLGQKLAEPHLGVDLQIPYAIVPNDSKLESLMALKHPHGLRPDRIKAAPVFSNAVSFCRYVDLFRDERTQVFANPEKLSFLAVIDYHGTGEMRPEFCDHKAHFTLKQSVQWQTWFGKNTVSFTQVEFAEFIEDNMTDIASPAPAFMLEVARDLNAKTDVNFASSVSLKNGQTQLRYEETIKGSVGVGNLDVPERFSISIPVFYGEDKITISIRLRFRISQGKLTFHYKMNGPTEILNDSFDKAAGSIGETLQYDILRGTM
jgi:uncharacterized protein YfdQ (DUF2303 family)